MESIKTRLQQYTKNNKQKLKDVLYIAIYTVIIISILTTIAYVITTKTNLYSNELEFRWDTILSYDDILYSRNAYTDNLPYENTIATIVKHPLMRLFGGIVTSIDNNLFQNENMGPSDHYFHVVIVQIIINAIGLIYLYKILREQYKLHNGWCFLLLTMYEIATVTVLSTLLIETFIISGTLLIISYYYLNKQKLIPSIILGILVTGMCTTNSVAFGLMAIFLLKNKKDIFKVGFGCAFGILAVAFLLPYRDILFQNFFSLSFGDAVMYSQPQTAVSTAKMIFFNLLASPLFFINQVHGQANGLDYVRFELASNPFVFVATIVFFGWIIYNIIKNIKDKQLAGALALLVFNMELHGSIKFGLYEGTIYGLHFLFAEILLFAFGFKIQNKKVKIAFITCAILILIIQLVCNIQGLANIYPYLGNWK